MSTANGIVGVIRGYRRGPNDQYPNQALIRVFTDPESLGGLVGARVIARDSHGNVYRGRVLKVLSLKNTTVVARFKPNIPGQLIGSYVEILRGEVGS